MKPKFWHSSVILFVLLALAFSTLGVTPALAASAWEQVGAAGFSAGTTSYTSLAIDSGGTPYVAYQDWANNYKASVMKFNGTAWEQVGSAGFSAGGASSTSLAIDSGGTPYVAYRDGGNSGNASVMKFNGTAWEQVGSAGFSAGQTDYTSLAIYSGTPYVAYTDTANSNKASVMKFNGTAWEQVGSAGFSAGGATFNSLAIDSGGTPYVAYRDEGNSAKASVMKFNGAAWEQVGAAGFSAGWAFYPSLAFDAAGTPYVAYVDVANGQKASVMKFNGAAWEQVGSAGFSAGGADYTSLAIYSGTPYVAYTDTANSNKASVMKFNGTAWEQVGSAGFSAGQANSLSLAIYSDTPYVAYRDIANIAKASVMKFPSAATTTALASSLNPSTFGNPVTFTATVSPTPDGGAVAFKDNGTVIPGCEAKSLSGGQAACGTSALTTGAHVITAEYSGNASYAASTGTLSPNQQVNQAAPILTWADPAAIDQGAPLSAAQLNATANVPGTFTYTPPIGTYLSTGIRTLRVDFVPTDAVNYANASKQVSLTINDHVLFNDVPAGHWARSFIERLALNQVTGGCGGGNFCPDLNITRDQMAVFILRAKHGPAYTPPAVGAGTGFNDVPTSHWAAAWIKQLVAEGISGGCGNNNFCPTQPVTRAQVAVMLLVAKHGTGYTPPAAAGLFLDVPVGNWAAPWAEQLVAEGIAGGCGGGNFCPNKYITRAEMAVFLVAAFNLP